MRIFVRIAGEGASSESGVVENGDFRFFRTLYLSKIRKAKVIIEMGQITKSQTSVTSVCLSPLLREQLSLDFCETLHGFFGL